MGPIISLAYRLSSKRHHLARGRQANGSDFGCLRVQKDCCCDPAGARTPRRSPRPSATRRSCATWRTRRSEEHTSELQSLMRISYAVFCLKKKKKNNRTQLTTTLVHAHIS